MTEVIEIYKKYVKAEREHYKKFNEKSKTLRAKVSVIKELANTLEIDVDK